MRICRGKHGSLIILPRCFIILPSFFILKFSPGFPGRNTDCLDERGDPVVWSSGGGLRERPQGLLQEADRDAQQPHHSPSWITLQGRKTESRENLVDLIKHKLQGDDNLYDRCPLKRCREQDDSEQDRVFFCLHVAIPTPTQVPSHTWSSSW